MNREELDAFFAKAEDVLTDWYSSSDSMHSSAASPTTDELPLVVYGGWCSPTEGLIDLGSGRSDGLLPIIHSSRGAWSWIGGTDALLTGDGEVPPALPAPGDGQ